MIEMLSATEACMKNENETLYDMNIVIKKSARLFKTEWMKKVKCYNCKEVSHIKKHCKKFKKSKINSSEKKNDSSDNNDKKIKKTEKKKFNN